MWQQQNTLLENNSTGYSKVSSFFIHTWLSAPRVWSLIAWSPATSHPRPWICHNTLGKMLSRWSTYFDCCQSSAGMPSSPKMVHVKKGYVSRDTVRYRLHKGYLNLPAFLSYSIFGRSWLKLLWSCSPTPQGASLDNAPRRAQEHRS